VLSQPGVECRQLPVRPSAQRKTNSYASRAWLQAGGSLMLTLNSVQGPLWFERLLAAGGRDSLVGLSVIGVGTRPGSIKAGIPS
jgi:hypothetical protein